MILSNPALLLVCAAVLLGCVLAFSYVSLKAFLSCRERNIFQHVTVAITVIPLAFVLCAFLVMTYNSLAESLHTFAKEHQQDLPALLVYAAAAVRPLSGRYSLTETLWMACLLFTAYGVANTWHHLIDLTRLLKASRRRLVLPEVREMKKNDEAATKAAKRR